MKPIVLLIVLCTFYATAIIFPDGSLPFSLQGCKSSFSPRPSIPVTQRGIRSKFVSYFNDRVPNPVRGLVYLEGLKLEFRPDTDTEVDFRQESNFYYLTGSNDPEFNLVIDLEDGKSTLFVPKRDSYYALWEGCVETPEQIISRLGVDEVFYNEERPTKIRDMTNNGQRVTYTLPGVTVPGTSYVNGQDLRPHIRDCRATKTKEELDLLKIAASVSSDAHIAVMIDSQPGIFEYNVDSFFKYYCGSCTLRHQAYVPIVGSGNASAILHYNSNRRQLKDGDLLLIDAGGEYDGYAADITRTFPINGKFTPVQKEIYEMVLKTVLAVESSLKPGVSWGQMSILARNTLVDELLAAGYLKGTAQEIISRNVIGLFFPHGLGHSVGLDVHDPGNVNTMQEGMVMTVEPGLYFNKVYVEIGMEDPNKAELINIEKVQPLLDNNFGGIRIEDVVVITEDGVDVISTAPKTVEDIEKLMNQ
mmetsp:Transcript_22763/g.25342  ORF Transcript_22763/g.25342 Transcript_22763/m.25342 type:complete len:474 (+) Transcript_22763:43-1464(+)